MVIIDFLVEDKASRSRFFKEIFLVADNKFEVILKILFLKINNIDVLFSEGTLMWKIYITNEALPTTKQVQIIDSKEFFIAALDIDSKIFVMHVAIQEQKKILVHSKNLA